jgi:hypothetical protein
MADRIEHFPAEKRPPTRRYPWNEWADGSVWKLVRGVDFDQEVDQFRNRLYPQAKRRGLKCRSAKRVERAGTLEREILIIQFYDPSELSAGAPSEEFSGNGTGAEVEEPAVA